MTSLGDVERFKVSTNLTLNSSFQAKGENYVLTEIFKDKTLANYFVGGSIMQVFFFPYNYHRYHASVGGEIVHAQVIPGFLYELDPSVTVPKFSGTKKEKLNNWAKTGLDGIENSLTYTSKLASRAVFVIKTNLKDEGGKPIYVGEVAIGVCEVSSTIIKSNIKKGVKVKQGDELGMFQYGGSSGLMIVSDPHFKWIDKKKEGETFYKMLAKVGDFKTKSSSLGQDSE